MSPDDEDTVVEEGIATHWRLEPKSRETHTLPSRSEQSDPANVLVAITDADERRRYADAFRYVGFGASEVTDGISCLSALRSGAFDMLVIDQHLLWGSGDGVVEVMYHDPSIDQIPVALLSFPSPDESPEGSASRLRAFGCTEIVHIVQQRLAGHD
ncbi:response regulator transcription factor [Stieleria sedimenti]|uniref:carbon storage regulator n=1 Tax=Stieleria sedimenti TaxID=2976331 RepID=UPI00217F8512|nr:carbon storage regulator [Stieleria sedimenti]